MTFSHGCGENGMEYSRQEKMFREFDQSLAKLLYVFLRSNDPPSPTLVSYLGLTDDMRLESDLDRLTFVFQHIPERASLCLARAFLRHRDIELSRSSPMATYSDLTGEPAKAERKSLTGFRVAFWAEGWKLARCAAEQTRSRIHGDSEAAFQRNYTLHILAVLSNPSLDSN